MKLLVVFGIIFAVIVLATALPHHEAGHDGAAGHDGESGHDVGHAGHEAEHEQVGHVGEAGKGGEHDGTPGAPDATGIPVTIVHDEDAKYAAAPEVPDIFLHVPIKN